MLIFFGTDTNNKIVQHYNTLGGAQAAIYDCCTYTPTAIDYAGGNLYWGQLQYGNIFKKVIGGGEPTVLYANGNSQIVGIDENGDKIYFVSDETPQSSSPRILNKTTNGDYFYIKVFEISDPSGTIAQIGPALGGVFGICYGPDYISTETSHPDPSPVLINGGGASLNEGGTFTFNDTYLKASNPDGDNYSIQYIITDGPLHGSISSSVLFKDISGGSFSQNDIANGKIEYIHDGSETTGDTLTFYLRDTEGDESGEYSFTFTITPVNDPPELESIPDLFIEEDTPETISTESYLQYAYDPDSPVSELTVSISTQCIYASLEDLGNGDCLINCMENWCGCFEFIVTVNDGEFSASQSVMVTVSEVNDLPILGGLPENILLEHAGSTNVILTATDIETPDSLLVFSATSTNDSVSVSIGENNSLRINANIGFEGEATITITVQDEAGGTDVGTFIVLVAANPTRIKNVSLPEEYSLSHNYPNPFNPSTVIKFGLPEAGSVKLEIYNLLGQRIKKLIDNILSAGYHEIVFNASDLPSAVYIYRIETSNLKNVIFIDQRKMILLK